MRAAHNPTWIESFLFLALMSGPPKFRERDLYASLEGAIDSVVVIHVGVWLCGGLWVLLRLYPAVLRGRVVPSVNRAQVIGALFIAALTLSLWQSPGFLLTAFTLGQFAVMLGFSWIFMHRFGPSACLRHLFGGVSLLALATVAALFLAPELVADETTVLGDGTRVLGNYIAPTSGVATIGLVLCLSNLPPLKGPVFWGALSFFAWLLVSSRTRSAYVAFLAFLLIGFIYGRRLRVRQLVLPLVALGFGLFVMDAVTSTTDFLVRERGSIETMSDRIPLWQHLTTAVMREAPLTGLGYYAASRIVATEYNPNLGNAHSAFFEVLVGGGMLGAALYVLLCASLVWFAVRLLSMASGQPSAVAAAGLLCVALLLGVTSEASLNVGPLGFTFWLLTALLPELTRQAARAQMANAQRPDTRQSTSLRAGAGGRLAVMNRRAE